MVLVVVLLVGEMIVGAVLTIPIGVGHGFGRRVYWIAEHDNRHII